MVTGTESAVRANHRRVVRHRIDFPTPNTTFVMLDREYRQLAR
jgi:hypothetical protein